MAIERPPDGDPAPAESESDAPARRIAELEREATRLRDEARRLHEVEAERLQAEKRVALGRLAAGMAHEINTPLQFVGDNLSFLAKCYSTFMRLAERHTAIHRQVAEGHVSPAEGLAYACEAERAADLAWLDRNVAPALAECAAGLRRVREIVKMLKEFALPVDRDVCECDVNEALMRALVVARGEYEAVADVYTDLGDVPRARCSLDDLHRVLFNVIVNAAQAIADRGAGRRGSIRVATRRDGEQVLISVSDDGCGIPEHLRSHIFEHFFTTREIGHGTGQGLALAWALIAQKHGGALRFESDVGRGTTFEVRLPVADAAAPGAVATAAG